MARKTASPTEQYKWAYQFMFVLAAVNLSLGVIGLAYQRGHLHPTADIQGTPILS